MYTRNVQDIWEALGSFWSTFQDKALIESVWSQYYTLASGMYDLNDELPKSMGMRDLLAVLPYRAQAYDIIYETISPDYSGIVNTIWASGSTGYGYEFYLTPGTFSIPTLTYYVTSTSGTLSAKQTLTEDVDYYIVDMERLHFVNNPPFMENQNQTLFKQNKLLADIEYRVNPALWGILPKLVELSEVDLSHGNYPAFVYSGLNTTYNVEHFKHLVWALQYYLRQKPTVANVKAVYELGNGLPFAYASGFYDGYNLSGMSHNPEVTALNMLYFTGSGYKGSNDFICLDKPAFFTHEGCWEFSAKFANTGVTQYVLGMYCYPGLEQSLDIYWDAAKASLNFKAKGPVDYALAQTGLSIEVLSLDIQNWHRYKIKRDFDNNDQWYCYVDDVLVGSGIVGGWETFDTPYTKFVVGARAEMDGSTWPPTFKSPFFGYVSNLKCLFGGDLFYTTHVNFLASTSGYNFIDTSLGDGGSHGYSWIVTASGGGSAFKWLLTSGIPLHAYTYLDQDDTTSQFQVLISGVNVYDFVNNSGYISNIVDTDIEKYRTCAINLDYLISTGEFSHNAEAVSGMLANFSPPDVTFITIS